MNIYVPIYTLKTYIMYNRRKKKKKENEISCMCIQVFELIMQKKTVRLYFIQNIHDTGDLIVHVHHSPSVFKYNYARRLEQQTQFA